jgi:hypothetical protein
MALQYKPDWEETKQRYEAWWNGEYFGRAALWVTAPKDDAPNEPPPEQPLDPFERWTNLDYIAAVNDWEHRRTFYGAEAFPIWHPGYPGAASVPTFLGCDITLDLATGWHEPILNDEEWDPQEIALDTSCFWYDFGIRMLQRAASEASGRCLPSIGAFGGTGDTLAAMRESMRLLYDVVDRPELVRRSEERILDIWINVFETYFSIVSPVSDGGNTSWFNLWAPGRFYPTHNDFSYMISPEMYRGIFLPVLRRQLDHLDYSVYHVDGIGAFVHVPMLCEIPNLQALQILPGAGKPSPLHYADTLRIVQKRGKGLHITIPADEVEQAVKTLSAKGLYIATRAETESQARELIRIVERYSTP